MALRRSALLAALLLSGCEYGPVTLLGIILTIARTFLLPVIWLGSIPVMTLMAYKSAARFSRRPWAYAVAAALADPLAVAIQELIPRDAWATPPLNSAWLPMAACLGPAPAVAVATWLLSIHLRRHSR